MWRSIWILTIRVCQWGSIELVSVLTPIRSSSDQAALDMTPAASKVAIASRTLIVIPPLNDVAKRFVFMSWHNQGVWVRD